VGALEKSGTRSRDTCRRIARQEPLFTAAAQPERVSNSPPLAARNLAGSLAALGRFAEAVEALEQAATLIEASDADGAAGLRRQAERYRADIP